MQNDIQKGALNFLAFVTKLAEQLKTLPGPDFQYRLSRNMRMSHEVAETYYATARASAVLILFYPVGDEIHTVLIQRPTYDGVHSGQVAFPGGKRDPADADLIATALREANEEVGVVATDLTVLNPLTPLYIPPSNFLVTPVVAIAHKRPIFTPNDREVEEILEINISRLQDDSLIGTKKITVAANVEVESPYLDLDGRTVWGATAMMISELKEVLRRVDEE